MSVNPNEHDRAEKALFNCHSIDALRYLTEHGRELEFIYQGQEYFLSRSGSRMYISLWQGKKEEPFNSMDNFFDTAMLQNVPFRVAWNEVTLRYLF